MDNKKLVGTVLIDFSKAFGYIPYDLFIAKLHALTIKALTFLYSYLKKRQLGVKLNDVESIFKIVLSGVPQDFILGPILFDNFISDLLFHFINKAKLANFADDYTICANSAKMKTLLDILERESETEIKYLK